MSKKQHTNTHTHHHGPDFVDVRALLTVHGFKVTQQRLKVLTFLVDAHEPCSIELIAHKVPSVNQVTLYRMLKQFADVGIVYQTDFRSGKAYFEFQEHHHHHVVCTSCGAQEAVDVCLPDSVANRVVQSSKLFTRIAHHALEFFGTCKRCTK